MAHRRREAVSLGGALVAHALVFAWMSSGGAPVPSRPGEAPYATPPPVDLTFDLAPEDVARQDGPAALAAIEPPASGLRRFASRPAEAALSSSRSGPSASPVSPGPAAEAPPSLATLSADALGIGAHNPFLTSLPDAPPASRAERPSVDNVAPGIEQSLRGALRDRDHDLGLDVSGPVVSIAEDLTRSSPTPRNSRALLEVVADASGNVTAVRLLDASEAWGEWDELASSLAQALGSRPLRVPRGAGGLVVTLEITSRWQLPSGHDPSTEVSLFNFPLKKAPADQKRPMKVELFKIAPKVVDASEASGVSAPIKLPRYQLQLGTILGLDVDPTDLAPRPIRVVHARVVKERTL